jgi:hypothetical protein
MAITWVEDNASRSATIARLGRKAQSVYRRSYKIFGSTNDIEVHADVNSRLSVNGLFWQYPGAGDQVLQAESYTLEYLGDDAWHLEVNYVKDGADNPEQSDPFRRSRSFDTGGATTHMTQGLPVGSGNTLDFEKRYPPSGENVAPNQSGAIGVDSSGVQGVDVVIPSLTWTETYDVPSVYVTGNYIKAISKLTGTVNSAAFRGFPAGEVLFVGASGSQEWDSQKGDGPWTLSYKFVQSPNAGPNNTGNNPADTLPPIQVGDITGIAKRGHEYLWVRYEDAVNSNALIKNPRAVYVNRIYREEDFSQLGIGGPIPSPASSPASPDISIS